MAYKGRFKPKNPQKYKGDPTGIIYRSLWECKMMSYFDSHPDVDYWSSEEIAIPYRSPIDMKIHRYFPDFVVRFKRADGTINTVMIEVKPSEQTRPPKKQSRVTKKYLKEVFTWGVNEAKWKAAQEYCRDRKWTFEIFTEKEIGIK